MRGGKLELANRTKVKCSLTHNERPNKCYPFYEAFQIRRERSKAQATAVFLLDIAYLSVHSRLGFLYHLSSLASLSIPDLLYQF